MNFCCLSYAVCGILLLQPEQTDTPAHKAGMVALPVFPRDQLILMSFIGSEASEEEFEGLAKFTLEDCIRSVNVF